MKIQNRKTGGLANIDELCVYTDAGWHDYHSLAELNEDWCDYEAPKQHWFIATDGRVLECNEDASWDGEKAIGNYFETREEAEKAVEKLRAWKSLKDKGIEFYGWRRNQTGTYEFLARWVDRIPRSYEIKKALSLLFQKRRREIKKEKAKWH